MATLTASPPRTAKGKPRLRLFIRSVHTYAGLLSFSALLIYGIAGLTATFSRGGEDAVQEFSAPRYEALAIPPGATDQQIQDLVYAKLQPGLAEPVPAWAFGHDEAGNLQFKYYSVNGITRVSVLKNESRIRIDQHRNGIWLFLDDVHAMTGGYKTRFATIRLWGLYNRLAMFVLLGLTLSGAYLWIASRPRYRAAQVLLAGGSLLCVLIYFALR